MPDCHDWFAEAAEAFVRYLVAKAGFEVFGQSEWGADLAIREREKKLWARCEVRSSDCKDEPEKKKNVQVELLANVTLKVDDHGERSTKFTVVFFPLNLNGSKIQPVPGGQPVQHEYSNPEGLTQWLRKEVFKVELAAGDCGAEINSLAEVDATISPVLR